MPVFSGDELKLVLRNVGLSELDSEFRFTIVGGSIRHALGAGHLSSTYPILEFLDKEFKWFFEGESVTVKNKEWMKGTVADAMRSATDPREAKYVFHKMFKHIQVDNQFNQIEIDWASPFLKHIAGAIESERDQRILDWIVS